MPSAVRKRRRRLSMTSLIDVIFLLLLFFMLSSTFTRFAEVDLAGAAAAGTGQAESRPVFVSLAPDTVQVNGTDATMETVIEAIGSDPDDPPVIVALRGAVTSQRLTDLLVVLRARPGLRVTVLGAT